MNFHYFLSGSDFFSRGPGGQVSHAVGILNGISDNYKDVCVYSEDNVSKYSHRLKGTVKVETFGTGGGTLFSILMSIRFLFLINKISKSSNEHILIRKNVAWMIVWLITLGFRLVNVDHNKIYWEVNGLTFERFKHKKFGSILYSLGLAFNVLMLRNSAGIYVVNNYLRDSLIQGLFSVDTSKVVSISNGGPDFSYSEVTNDVKSAIRFVFYGVFQSYNNFQLVIDAFNQLSESFPEASLYIVGYGKEKEHIKDLVSYSPNIHILEPKEHHELLSCSIVNSKSVGLIPLKDDFGSRFLSPIKMFDYFSLGMPVIASSTLNYRLDYSVDGGVYVYDSDNLDSLVSVMKSFFRSDYDWCEQKVVAKVNSELNSWTSKMSQLYQFFLKKEK